MRMFLLLLVTSIATICMSTAAKAQTVSSKIMDTGIDWTNSGGGGVDGQLKVFLTDTIGIAGLTVMYGSEDSSSNYFGGQYTISGSGNYWTSGTAVDNTLSLPIGHFSESVTGHLRVIVLLDDGSKNMMNVVK